MQIHVLRPPGRTELTSPSQALDPLPVQGVAA